MTINFCESSDLNNLVIGVAEDFKFEDHFALDKALQTPIMEIIKLHKFEGKASQTASLTIAINDQLKCIILIGLGKHKDFGELSAVKFGSNIISTLKCLKLDQTAVILESRLRNQNEFDYYANIAYGIALRNYNFLKYKSAEKQKNEINIGQIDLVSKIHKTAEKHYESALKPVANSVHFSRDLVSEPANIIYPDSFAKRAKAELEPLGVKVTILSEEQMQNLGMNALLGVGQGSSKESKLLVLEYYGGNKGQAPLAFVGKGVTFDTGGISIKPANGMEDMKYDMAGAAIVTGLARAVAARKAKVNIVCIAGLVENMPDGNAQRPSDVVKSMSGQTIEIINTDAEGRLVLADALWYCQDKFKPEFIVDLATLTGAIVVALGTNSYAGLFSNNDQLAKELTEAGARTDELLWRLPLGDDYDKMIDSDIADVRNTGQGKGGGSITAAQFLQRFVNNVKWAHLDIANMAWAEKSGDFYPKGATGFGLRLLNDLIKNYEK